MTIPTQPLADILVANESCRRDTELTIKECINRIIEMRDKSPYASMIESGDIEKRHDGKSAELGRQGAYSVIITILKIRLLNDQSFSDGPYTL